MKYFVIALVILILGLLIVQFSNADQVLASADHALSSVSGWTGNPNLLLEVRNSLHAYRYAHTQPPASLKMRLARQGEPPRVVPPAPLVIDPRVYQYNRPVQPHVDAPQPSVQAPTNVAPVAYSDDFNEPFPKEEWSKHDSWEKKFVGNVNHDVATGWTGYTVWGQPTVDGEFTCVHSPEWSQKISGYATFRAGIWRQFTVAQGTSYNLSVWGHLHILGGGAIQVGIDPTGGTEPSAASVIWLQQLTELGQWRELTATGQTQSGTITVFLEAFSLLDDNCNAYFDDLSLQAFQTT